MPRPRASLLEVVYIGGGGAVGGLLGMGYHIILGWNKCKMPRFGVVFLLP